MSRTHHSELTGVHPPLQPPRHMRATRESPRRRKAPTAGNASVHDLLVAAGPGGRKRTRSIGAQSARPRPPPSIIFTRLEDRQVEQLGTTMGIPRLPTTLPTIPPHLHGGYVPTASVHHDSATSSRAGAGTDIPFAMPTTSLPPIVSSSQDDVRAAHFNQMTTPSFRIVGRQPPSIHEAHGRHALVSSQSDSTLNDRQRTNVALSTTTRLHSDTIPKDILGDLHQPILRDSTAPTVHPGISSPHKGRGQPQEKVKVNNTIVSSCVLIRELGSHHSVASERAQLSILIAACSRSVGRAF